MTPIAESNASPSARGGALGIGAEIRSAIFRDTKTFYSNPDAIQPAPRLMAFARRNAGPVVLDLGCATGAYCLELTRHGFRVTGADVNADYVRIARSRGVDAHRIEGALPFADAAFDTVVMFEVLEHVAEPDSLLREAKRVARLNVLVTVPNCERHDELQQRGLLFEHFADLDHRNFFTGETLQELLAPHFRHVSITRGDPINPLALFRSRLPRMLAGAAWRLRLLRPRYHFRLYAVATI